MGDNTRRGDQGTVSVEVIALRGRNDGADGFWIIQRCQKVGLDSLSFLYSAQLPNDKAIAETVVAYSERHGGLSGMGAPIVCTDRDHDRARWVVAARLTAPGGTDGR